MIQKPMLRVEVCFVLLAMGYMTEQLTLTSKKQTVTIPFWVNCLILRHERTGPSSIRKKRTGLFLFFPFFFAFPFPSYGAMVLWDI